MRRGPIRERYEERDSQGGSEEDQFVVATVGREGDFQYRGLGLRGACTRILQAISTCKVLKRRCESISRLMQRPLYN